MSRFHMHVGVENLQQSVKFYSALFGQGPTVVKDDYAKWELDDPRINFAISTRSQIIGLDHVGIQAEDETELADIRQRLDSAGIQGVAQEQATCCYAKSDKYWVQDPQNIAWETFQTLDTAPVFSTNTNAASCTPSFSSCC